MVGPSGALHESADLSGEDVRPDETALSAAVGDRRVGRECFTTPSFRGIGGSPMIRRASCECPDIGHEDPVLSPTEGTVAGVDLPFDKLCSLGDAFVGHAK